MTMTEPIPEKDVLQVDIYWPNEDSYGIPKRVYTLKQAAQYVAELRRSGYGNPTTGPHVSIIQVRRIQVHRFPLEMLEASNA